MLRSNRQKAFSRSQQFALRTGHCRRLTSLGSSISDSLRILHRFRPSRLQECNALGVLWGSLYLYVLSRSSFVLAGPGRLSRFFRSIYNHNEVRAIGRPLHIYCISVNVCRIRYRVEDDTV
jgi:hypothetical protein